MRLTVFAPSFTVGIILFNQLPELPKAWTLLLLLPPLLLLYRRRGILRWVAPLVLGFVWAWGHAVWFLQGGVSEHLEGKDLLVNGRIVGLPEQRGTGVRFLLHIEETHGVDEKAVSGSVQLTWYRDAPRLGAGERWRLRIRLKAPHGFSNPGGFDYEGRLFREHVRATGYVRPDNENRRLAEARFGVDRLRQILRDRLVEAAGDSEALGFIQALTLGDRSAIDQDQWDVLTRTGTNHLIAISGLHVGILAGLAFFLMRGAWRRSSWLTQRLAADRAAAVGALAAASGYAALAGFSISTQRALIMLALVLGAVFLRRTMRPGAGLLAALTLVLVFDPLASLSCGFWLSFTAVGVLLYGMTGRVGPGGVVWHWGRAQWLVALGLLPLLFLLFGQASVVAPMANLVAVPLFSLFLLPMVLAAAFLAVVGGIEWPLHMTAWLLQTGSVALERLAVQPWAAWTIPDQPVWVWLLAFMAVVLLLAPRGLPGRWAGIALLAPLFLIRPEPPEDGEFRFTLLDVGQGLAAVIQTRRHVLVYDTGPAFSSGFNTGTAVILPFLRARGLRRIDRLIVSHADKDHAGGLFGLLGQIPISAVYSGEPEKLGEADARLCRAGSEWLWDSVRFQVLHPSQPLPVGGNKRSCVLRVENETGAVLITGDVDAAVERKLIAKHAEALTSRVLVAGHHGSRTSTSEGLLHTVTPEYVLFSAGYRNRYGFPQPEVLARVEDFGAVAIETMDEGAIEFQFFRDSPPTAPRLHRYEQMKYWTHRP